jgi:uroporphyrinogen decarboxylase
MIEAGIRFLEQSVKFSVTAGWEFVTAHSVLNFPGFMWHAASEESRDIKGGRRAYIDSNKGPIMSWEDFENYQWPESPGIINAGNKFLAEIVPAGMKVLVLPGGLFEWTTWLMGMVPFSLALYDQPELVDAVIEKLSEIIYKGAEELMDIPNIGGLFIGDDMGFYSGTLIKPDILREKFLPHLKRITDMVHQAGKLVLLHSCGNLESIMDDICDTGIDAKHSFEDKIMPVEKVYQRWGNRIGIIGGVDVNLLSEGSELDIRNRTREILDVCAPGGGYVLGTGNSVASYIPVRNYLIMMDEGRKWNLENFSREY